MSPTPARSVCFADLLSTVASGEVWEYTFGPNQAPGGDAAERAATATGQPIDFPPLAAAIVPGDSVALAVDPNVPELVEVVRGLTKVLRTAGAEKIDVVLWDEADESSLAALRSSIPDLTSVQRHNSRDRESLRYLAADEAALPIYLNRTIVDADFVLPVFANRPLDRVCQFDPAGVFPVLADSATRIRHRDNPLQDAVGDAPREPAGPDDGADAAAIDAEDAGPPIGWMLGVQLVVTVSSDAFGRAGQIVAGTPDAVRKQQPVAADPSSAEDFPPRSELTIASLDGDAQQQTWANAARALASATRYVQPGGTILLWTEIDSELPTRHREPGPSWDDTEEGETRQMTGDADDLNQAEPTERGEFPEWDGAVAIARTIARVLTEHRVLIHCQLDEEIIESMSLGFVASPKQLGRISSEFDSCGVLRAAQFTGSTLIDQRHPSGDSSLHARDREANDEE